VRALFVPWGGHNEEMRVIVRRYLGGARSEET